MIKNPQDTSRVLEALKKGDLHLEGQFLNSSNYTFFMRVGYQGCQFNTVYKPVRGERPLWDFPRGTLSKREAAAFLVSNALKWHLVPPTILRKRAPLGPGSLQLFIEHDPEYNFFSFNDEDRQRLRPVVLFDILVNNADRKGSHIIFDHQKNLWLIDHGICFHIEDKLRTVIWDFAGEQISEDLLDQLQQFLHEIEKKQTIYQKLGRFLLEQEIEAMAERGNSLLRDRYFPFPSKERRPYPWPPV